jgi:hypothetical protein
MIVLFLLNILAVMRISEMDNSPQKLAATHPADH